jgi:predicted RNA-binding Zn ribbon-like protein
LAERCRFRPEVSEGGRLALRPDRGGDPAGLGALLLIIRDAQRDGTWDRLKACRNAECRWAYYDRSHAGRGAWCDMAVCGNRIKNRNLRSRRSAAAGRQG